MNYTEKKFLRAIKKSLKYLQSNKCRELSFVWFPKCIYDALNEEQRVLTYQHYAGMNVYFIDVDFVKNKQTRYLLQKDGTLKVVDKVK